MTVECVSRTANLGNCACTNADCERRGVCCACVANHRTHGNLPACLRPETD